MTTGLSTEKKNKIAIMQPYFFPYIGYYQLAASADDFIFYDDVNFIEGGWINRNYMISREGRSLFTVPLIKPSPNRLINEIQVQENGWQEKFRKSLQHTYSKAPYFNSAIELISLVIAGRHETIASLAGESVRSVFSYLSLPVNFCQSSERNYDRSSDKVGKIISIAQTFDCSTILFPPGSKNLYRDEDFAPRGYASLAVIPKVSAYKQFSSGRFEPHLSMIDVLMFNSLERIREMLEEKKLEKLND